MVLIKFPLKPFYLLVCLSSSLFFLSAGKSTAETVSWKSWVGKLAQRVDRGSVGRDTSISFENSPYANYTKDELMAYTVRGDGSAIVQMHDQVREIRVSPNEVHRLAQFLLDNGIADFAEDEANDPGSAAFSIIIRLGPRRQGMWLYNRYNDVKREIVWQYLFRLGQRMLEQAGLRDKERPILPVCKGILREDALDMNNDGVIEWMKVRIGWYSFKPGNYSFDFAGFKQTVFLSQGKSEKDFFINTYFLRPDTEQMQEYLKMAIDSQPPYPTGPYRMDIGLAPQRFREKKLRTSADAEFDGTGTWNFNLSLHQAAALEFVRRDQASMHKVLRFVFSDILANGVQVIARDETVFMAPGEKNPVGDFGCISGVVGLESVEGNTAVFSAGWQVPEIGAVQRKVDYFAESLASDNFHGDKESVKSSLAFCEECLKDLNELGQLKIRVIYCSGP